MFRVAFGVMAGLIGLGLGSNTAFGQYGYHLDYVPHTTTHYDRVQHGLHSHVVPHTTTHYHAVPHAGPHYSSPYATSPRLNLGIQSYYSPYSTYGRGSYSSGYRGISSYYGSYPRYGVGHCR